MPFSSSPFRARRDRVRRQRSEQTEPWLQRWRERIGPARALIVLCFCVGAIVAVLYGGEPFPCYANQELLHPVYARVGFKILDPVATEQSKQSARELTPNYYTLNTELIERVAGDLGNLYNVAQAHDTYADYEQARQALEPQDAAEVQWALGEAEFKELDALSGEAGKAVFARWVDHLIEDLKHERFVPAVEDAERGASWKSNIAVLKGASPNKNDTVIGDDELEVSKLELMQITNLRSVQTSAAALSAAFPSALRGVITQILTGALQERPLLRFDAERTRAKMADEADRTVAQTVNYDPYAPLAKPMSAWESADRSPAEAGSGNRSRGLTQGFRLDDNQLTVLKAEHEKIQELLHTPQEKISPGERAAGAVLKRQHRLEQIGLGALTLIGILGMGVYCALFQPRVIQRPVRLLSLAVLFLIMMAGCRTLYLSQVGAPYPLIVVGPVVMAAAILTLVYSQRFALGMTAALALLITLTVRGDLNMLLVLTASLAVAVYQLREIRTRHEIFSTGLLNALAAFAITLITVVVSRHSIDVAVEQAASAAVAAVGAIAFFFLMLAPIETIFKVATNWTLLELLDTSRPLLSRLAREAPGTFAHSLWLSNMAEAACQAIGANALLAKVGAMYHDIGKVHKAEYFAENQEANISRHERLSPTLSLLVIVGHVKDGVELAREERLPHAIIRFIEEHHGTTVVRYFLHAASEQQKAAGLAREVSESEFRYPGPKPQSKETAVLMLCDGVEGAVRTLQEPTAGRIENVVHNVLMDRLNDGQFEDCDITLKELHKVEESLVKTLCRFYHGRVAYPKAAAPKKPAEAAAVPG